MSWLLPALLSPIFAAAVNHIDKALLSRYFKGGGAGSLVIFSALIGIPVSLLIATFSKDVFVIAPMSGILLIFNGMFYMMSIIPYFYALAMDEASVVSPLTQMISPIGLVLSFFLLGERVSSQSILGGLIITVCAIALSLEIKKKRKVKIKTKVIGLMLLASFLFALNGLIFKMMAIESPFWTTAFWEYLGVIIFGVLALCFVRSYRHQFLKVISENNLSILSINAINEVCAVIAKLSIHFASVLAPLAIVFWVAEGFQPVFVVVFGILLTRFFPNISKERIDSTTLTQRATAILGMLFGTFLLSS